jgi:hypothetical protein
MPAHYDKNLSTEFGVTGSDLNSVAHRDPPHSLEPPGVSTAPGEEPEWATRTNSLETRNPWSGKRVFYPKVVQTEMGTGEVPVNLTCQGGGQP